MSQRDDINLADCIFLTGRITFIGYAIRANRKKEAKEYIESFGKSLEAKFAVPFKRKVDGEILNSDRFSKLPDSDDIFEFKCFGQPCILCFKFEGGWWLTHGYNRKSNRTPKRQIQRAEQIKEEHIKRFS